MWGAAVVCVITPRSPPPQMGVKHYRRGVNIELHAFEARRLVDHVAIGDVAIPLVQDGTILEIARDAGREMQISSSVQPVAEGMSSDNITITVTAQEPVQVGPPHAIRLALRPALYVPLDLPLCVHL